MRREDLDWQKIKYNKDQKFKKEEGIFLDYLCVSNTLVSQQVLVDYKYKQRLFCSDNKLVFYAIFSQQKKINQL